ncbi:Formation of crista junctions protein 1, partial [Cladochytrium tenue]
RDEEFENVFHEIQKSGREELTERLSEARKEFELELDARLSEQATRYLEVLDTELQSQSAELENQWKKRARTMVDNERDGRLAKLDNLVLKLKQLEKISLDTSDYLRSSHIAHIQAAALEAVNAALSEDHQTPFVRELDLLRRFSKGDEVLGLAVGAISENVARRGLVPIEEFSRELSTLEASIRRVQLMPERGGPISYVVSNLLSVFVFPKHGMVAGGDVEAILARAQHHMARGNLDGAAREINQLKGWPKKMAADWLSAAREHLEVKQALEVS